MNPTMPIDQDTLQQWFFAVSNGTLDALKAWHARGDVDINANQQVITDPPGFKNALSICIYRGRVDVLEWLLHQPGLNKQLLGYFGEPLALSVAFTCYLWKPSEQGTIPFEQNFELQKTIKDVVELLEKAGVDFNQRAAVDSQGSQRVLSALEVLILEVVSTLNEEYKSISAFLIELLIKKGAVFKNLPSQPLQTFDYLNHAYTSSLRGEANVSEYLRLHNETLFKKWTALETSVQERSALLTTVERAAGQRPLGSSPKENKSYI